MSVIRLGRGNKIYCSKQVTQERRLLAHWRCPLSQKVHNKPDASPLLPMAAMEQADRNTVRPQSRANLRSTTASLQTLWWTSSNLPFASTWIHCSAVVHTADQNSSNHKTADPRRTRRPLYTRGKQLSIRKKPEQPLRPSAYMGSAHSDPRKANHSPIRCLELSKSICQHLSRADEHYLSLCPSDGRIYP